MTEAASSHLPGTDKRILVVDDDASTCLLVRSFLERFGYEVLSASDAEAGLALVEEVPLDLVVSDMRMPGRSGLELLEEIKQQRPYLPVIIITGKPKVEAAVACMRTGAFDYLTKPLNLQRFLDHVQEGIAARDRLQDMSVTDSGERTLTRWRSIADYDIRSVLGEGGLGIVFLAEKADEAGELQQYALKVLKPEILNQKDDMDEALQRFMREAKMASSVIHPNVIRIVEYGLAQEEQIPYIVMEYIEGEPLSYYIMNGDLLDYDEKAWILRQAAGALSAVHSARMFHRDIKPDNMLISADLTLTLTDFGIATSLGASRLTTTGFIVGSPAYMSPELYEHKEADARSDIFALGTVAYELFLGVAPFDGDNLDDLSQAIRNEDPLDPKRLDPQLPMSLARIIDRMLAKNPADRYQTARGIVAALDEYLEPDSLLKNLMKKLG